MAAMADMVSTDTGCGGHQLYKFLKLVWRGLRVSLGDTCLARGCHPPRDRDAQFGALKGYCFGREGIQSLEEP
jgi:hypothetical protein